jgi:hypothetical protein
MIKTIIILILLLNIVNCIIIDQSFCHNMTQQYNYLLDVPEIRLYNESCNRFIMNANETNCNEMIQLINKLQVVFDTSDNLKSGLIYLINIMLINYLC